jgi:hypothetical protein
VGSWLSHLKEHPAELVLVAAGVLDPGVLGVARVELKLGQTQAQEECVELLVYPPPDDLY